MDLRGASAEALAELRSRLDDAASSTGAAATIGDELFTVSRLLRSEPGVRRFATDVSLPAEAKQGMVRSVFTDRLSQPTLDLLTEAVGKRWTLSRDLPDALERLGEVAVVKSAGTRAGEVTDEVFALAQAVNGTPELRDALTDPQRSVGDKAGLLESLLDGKALPATITLAKQSLVGTYRTVSAALENYRRVAAEVQDESVATVRVARALSEEDQRRLGQALQRQFDREVHLNVVVDPDVLGGMRVEVGDQVIDGTISSRLDAARRQLAG